MSNKRNYVQKTSTLWWAVLDVAGDVNDDVLMAIMIKYWSPIPQAK